MADATVAGAAFQGDMLHAFRKIQHLLVGWAGLGVAALADVRVHMVWAKFFVTFRKFDNSSRADGARAS
jgi:hypothetical protein